MQDVLKVFFIADKVQTEAPQNPSGLGKEIEGYVLPENFAGNFYLIDNKILIFFFTAISDLTQKLLLALFQDFLEQL